MLQNLRPTWDLEVIFPGGSRSPEFASYLASIESSLAQFRARVMSGMPGSALEWEWRIQTSQELMKKLRQAGAFVSCLTAQNVGDSYARLISGKVRQIHASFSSVMSELDSHMKNTPDEEWNSLLQRDSLRDLAFNLNERRERARRMLPPEQEALVGELSVDGYHGWSDLYDMVTGRMTITLDYGDQRIVLSPGQAANRMSDPDPAFRAHVMAKWEEAWAREAELCALALNRLAGFRLTLYRKRGWDSVLREPLEINRMSAETLEAMWDAVNQNKGRLVQYLQAKKSLLGLASLGWQDVSAPVGKSEAKMSYEEGARFIVEQFQRFSPRMAQFARMAFEQRWVEAEDRPGKAMGGFCTNFPESRQSRIFMTFSGTMGNVATLAHELGHGYHQSLMNDLPPLCQQYPMNLAETASTFAEMIVADAALASARTREERLALIDDKLQRAVSLLMNIQSRFLFETRFYAERKAGMVSVERLNEIMTEAQKEAYAGALDTYHPHFWASKLHFYNTRVPFYNFPYTFGYLFSAGVYARALEEGPAFEDRYACLLRDTGRMRVEDLARVHLGVDLSKPSFWQQAIDLVLADLGEFLELSRYA